MGERVLVLLLALAVVISALFLLLPFVAIRSTWRRLPGKWTSALFFAAIGFGFMFFEVTLMQLLNLFLGYPTYALTVTLMSLLVFTGARALSQPEVREPATHRPRRSLVRHHRAHRLLRAGPDAADRRAARSPHGRPRAHRLRPAGATRALSRACSCRSGSEPCPSMSDARREYVAWGWAVNGFASVVGAVLATLLSMTFGFHDVLWLGLAAYLLALVAWRRLAVEPRPRPRCRAPEPSEPAHRGVLGHGRYHVPP